jgi:DNA repair protein RecN (Recombination protein N)
VQEIEAAGLEELDEAQLLAEHATVANAKRILELAEGIDRALAEDDTSVFNNLVQVQRLLQELATIVPAAGAWKTEAATLAGQAGELARTIVGFAQRIDAEPERLQALEDRLAQLHQLKRKYGPAVTDILATLQSARARLTDLETRGERAAALDKQIEAAAQKVKALGKDLSTQRRASAKKLAKDITAELRDLGFAHGTFDVTLTGLESPGPAGCDAIEFGFAPNVGEPIRPLRAIASSGEMSRVMLATKSVLAAHDQIPVLVFDEVDANVGGEMANAVGDKLRTVATGHQVLCITHLPQVAVQGAHHHVVTKTVRAGRTVTNIHPVTDQARAEEIARMLGGRDLTTVTIRHAEELLTKYAAPRPRSPKPKPN